MSNYSPAPGPLHDFMKAMIDGIPKLPAGVTSLTVLNTTYTMPQLVAKVMTYEAFYAAVVTATLAQQTAVENRAAIEPDAAAFLAATRTSFKAALGKTAAALELVGITPDKVPAPLTAEQITKKVAQAKATRAARHTMGKKAKSKLKGVPPATPPGG